MAANDVNGHGDEPQNAQHKNGHVPRTPSLSGLSLSEYSPESSPLPEDKKASMKKLVPDHLLLPNGYPDVSCPPSEPGQRTPSTLDNRPLIIE
jgi:hypothetical protein